jgi:hypothetical protein
MHLSICIDSFNKFNNAEQETYNILLSFITSFESVWLEETLN